MKIIISALLTFILIAPCLAQEKKVFLNFYGGVAAFKSDVTPIAGDMFKSSELYTVAPTGLSLGIEFIKNTFVDIQFGTQTWHNDYMLVINENFGFRRSSGQVTAANFGIQLKYEFILPKSFSLTPFIGFSTSYLNQPEGLSTPLRITSKTSSESYVNGVLTNSQRDSLYVASNYLSNSVSGISFGGELGYRFKNKWGIYLAYSFFYNQDYYATQYGELRSTEVPTQKALLSYGKSGYFYQIGLKYHLFNIKKVVKTKD